MPVTNYYSVGGQLLGECTNGVETTYMSDAQGSTIGTITTAGLRNRYIYNPYGSLLSKTGADANPRYMYNGKGQSRTTGCAYAEQYNRRRHVSTTTAQWTTRDLLWPRQRPYGYAGATPVTRNDPSGLDDDGGPLGRHLRFGTPVTISHSHEFKLPPHTWPGIPIIWDWDGDLIMGAPGRCLYVTPGGGGSGPWVGGSGDRRRQGADGGIIIEPGNPKQGHGCNHGGPKGACIAGLCSGDAASKYFGMFKEFVDSLEEGFLSFVFGWGAKEGIGRGDWGLDSLNPNPEGCCETAWGEGGSNGIGALIGTFCDAQYGLYGADRPCEELEQTRDGCIGCCRGRFTDEQGNLHQNLFELTCEGNCQAHNWNGK